MVPPLCDGALNPTDRVTRQVDPKYSGRVSVSRLPDPLTKHTFGSMLIRTNFS